MKRIKSISLILTVPFNFQNCSKFKNDLSNSNLISPNSRGLAFLKTTDTVEGRELISDPRFMMGFNAQPACLQPDTDPACAAIATYPVINPYYKPIGNKSWTVSQWGSLSSLPIESEYKNNYYSYANSQKFFRFYKIGNIEIAVNSLAETGGSYVNWDNVRKWPHLLLAQAISEPSDNPGIDSGSLALMTELNFRIDAQLTFEQKNHLAGYNSGKHTSQFTVYFTVQNLNQKSPGYGQYIWLGVPVYEERSAFPPAFIKMDEGTKSLIYTMAYNFFTTVSIQSGQLVSTRGNILPSAIDAVNQAASRKILISGNLNDYKIGSMNLGFEITGLNTTSILFSNLSLRAKTAGFIPAPDEIPTAAPEGFHHIADSDGIYYSNGVDAFCVFTNWETFVKWGGSARPVGKTAGLPQGMRNDGACP